MVTEHLITVKKTTPFFHSNFEKQQRIMHVNDGVGFNNYAKKQGRLANLMTDETVVARSRLTLDAKNVLQTRWMYTLKSFVPVRGISWQLLR